MRPDAEVCRARRAVDALWGRGIPCRTVASRAIRALREAVGESSPLALGGEEGHGTGDDDEAGTGAEGRPTDAPLIQGMPARARVMAHREACLDGVVVAIRNPA